MKNLHDLTNRNPQMITRLAEPTSNWGCPFFPVKNLFVYVSAFKVQSATAGKTALGARWFLLSFGNRTRCFDFVKYWSCKFNFQLNINFQEGFFHRLRQMFSNQNYLTMKARFVTSCQYFYGFSRNNFSKQILPRNFSWKFKVVSFLSRN